MNYEKNQLQGHTKFLNHFCMANQANKLHHAYLLYGSVGIGKSFLAKQLAAYLLEGREQHISIQGPAKFNEVEYALSLNDGHSVWRQVFCHAHPDMIYLSSSRSEDNKSGQIKVEDIKSVKEITNHQSGRGGWRIIIIDSIDDTNRNGANAILKILEEPPNKTIFFLISHNISNVTATIRSRCQQFKLYPLPKDKTRLILEKNIQDVSSDQLEQLVLLCEGSPGMALLIYKTGADKYIDELNENLKKGRSGIENILQLSVKWGNNFSKNPELYRTTKYIFDKLFSDAAFLAMEDDSEHYHSKTFTSNIISEMVITLAQNYTAVELANMHIDWQQAFRTVETNYLDMNIFMQQTFYKIYSHMHIR